MPLMEKTILSSASSHDLYKISVANGLQDTWEQWWGITTKNSDMATKVGTTGSFMKLMFGKDITLQAGEHVGKVSAYNLQLSLNVTNVNQGASIAEPSLYIICSNNQKFIIHEGGQVESILGIEASEDGEYLPYSEAMKYYGGSFGDFMKTVGRILGKSVGFLRDTKLISNVASMIPHPVAQWWTSND